MDAILYIRRRQKTLTGRAKARRNPAPWQPVFAGTLSEARARMETVNDRRPAWGKGWDAYIDATGCENAPQQPAHVAGCACAPCAALRHFADVPSSYYRPFTAIHAIADAIGAIAHHERMAS